MQLSTDTQTIARIANRISDQVKSLARQVFETGDRKRALSQLRVIEYHTLKDIGVQRQEVYSVVYSRSSDRGTAGSRLY